MKRILLFLALLSAPPFAAAQHCGAPGIGLQVLGSSGPDLMARRANNSTLLWIEDKARVLVDAGSGTVLRFAESGASLRDLDAVVLTSLYADHTSDLAALLQAATYETRTSNLPVFGPPGHRQMPSTVTFVRDLFDGTRGAWRHLGDYLSPLAKTDFKLLVRDIRRPPARLGGKATSENAPWLIHATERLQIRAAPTLHGNVPSLALRIESYGKTIVFAGDARAEDAALQQLATGADLLLAYYDAGESHATAGNAALADIARLAHSAKARQLVLIHRSVPTAGKEREEAALATIRRHFAGPVHFPEDLACYLP